MTRPRSATAGTPGHIGALAGAGFCVRRARPAELDAAGACVRAAYAQDDHASGDYLDVLADARGRARDAEVVVAVTADPSATVVGSVTFALPQSRWAELARPGEAEFRALGVLPGARGLGVGAALVSWCVARARGYGAHRLVLCSLPTMASAHALYSRLGFTRRPDLDWTVPPDVHLFGFSLDLPTRRPVSR